MEFDINLILGVLLIGCILGFGALFYLNDLRNWLNEHQLD